MVTRQRTDASDDFRSATDWRRVESGLATFTLVALAIFIPAETYASWVFVGSPRFLIHPGYLHSVTGMVLLFVGARHSLRMRPRCAPGLMCAAHAWWGATSWTSAQWRVQAIGRGAELRLGSPEFWFVAIGTAITFCAFALSLCLTYRCARRSTA